MIVVYWDSMGQVGRSLAEMGCRLCNLGWPQEALATVDDVALAVIHSRESGLAHGKAAKEWVAEFRKSGKALVIAFTGSRTESVEVVTPLYWICSRSAVIAGIGALLAAREKSGKWEPSYLQHEPSVLVSAAIHDLNNLPVRLDVETAEEVVQLRPGKAKEMLPDCAAMWLATFGGTDPEILHAVRTIAARQDAAHCTVDEYLTRLEPRISLVEMVAERGPFRTLVRRVAADFVHQYGEPSAKANEKFWTKSRRRQTHPTTSRLPEAVASERVTALKALAEALRIIADAVDNMLIAPLQNARQQVEAFREPNGG